MLDSVKNGKGYANFKRCSMDRRSYRTGPTLWQRTHTHTHFEIPSCFGCSACDVSEDDHRPLMIGYCENTPRKVP